jgi:protease-4
MSFEGNETGAVPQSAVRTPPRDRWQAPPTRRSTGSSVLLGCLIAFCAGIALVGLLIVVLVLLVAATAVGGAGYATTLHRGVQVVEYEVSGPRGAPKVAIIPLRGVLMSGGEGIVGTDPVLVLRSMLDRASADADVHGVILAVNSPGGAITTCDVMYKALNDFRDETHKPVVVLMEDVAASGGYYVSCAADYIIAHPTTTTGSIGVMMPMFDASGLLKKVGVADRTVKSGPFKDLGSMFAEKTPEEREREAEILTGLVTYMYEQFVKVVADGRGLDPQAVRVLADGRIYTPQEAKDKGLIDDIGYREDAVAKAEALAGLAQAHVVEYGRTRGLVEMLFMRAGSPEFTVRLDGGLQAGGQAPLMYLWRPPTNLASP